MVFNILTVYTVIFQQQQRQQQQHHQQQKEPQIMMSQDGAVTMHFVEMAMIINGASAQVFQS